MANHSRIGASSAYRWFECPGSVSLVAVAPPQEDTIYSKQGTAAHWVLEEILKSEKTRHADEFVGETAPNGYEITQEDADAVQKGVDFVNEERKLGKFLLYTEVQFDLENIYPGLFGTSDVALLESNLKRLKVMDYKHGAGIPVEVESNKQLMYYALGAIKKMCDLHKIDYLSVLGWGEVFKEVEIIVVQPRCRHKGGAVRRWVIPNDELAAFAVELAEKAKATTNKNARLKAGDHCKFCPAIGTCPEINRTVMDVAKVDFAPVSHPSNLVLPSVETLTKDEIVKILNFKDILIDFFKQAEAHAQTMLEHGQEVPGFKLVRKKSNRDWKDEDEAKDALSMYVKEDEMYSRKFISPAQAEKLLGKKQKKVVEDLCYKPDGGTTIAPEHDPREALPASAIADFAKEEKPADMFGGLLD